MGTDRLIQANAVHKPFVGASGKDRTPQLRHGEETGNTFLWVIADHPWHKTDGSLRQNYRPDKLPCPPTVSGEETLWIEMFNRWLDASL